ncbi:MAG: glutathione S-transferase family protein [Cyanobacteria bacterium QH_8_48_120]|jgi:glutathione S-transferase|nr:MAG: glutathione S-transferase family protein [Cyanobacteria bacterium QH_1_48_107]PSO57038.1 MAG: glutathione S-transferase family protein [Cyanobacteria bacterium QH_10_48_56]PSO64071.1 MAG: glutathione S-transferase family protein [Cyanobacteria bacterium QH_7_48_89]PSO65931.1 MAG: glutathione S-transferase family protein [Cyanobacteria bacterium QH_6_48_35]PSO68622.1 MAG: glutathione S-transferase family protein [Cyanobacteria bacterium QS_1_48_34]PSO73838.1 MAG: glutathione S-transfera
MTVEIYSASVCPFAHRTRLTLLEKGVEFNLTEIDLENKPDWFAEVSPYQKVPVIKHGENRIWESAIINEYLEEVFPNPPLMPQQPEKRALARIWIDFAETRFVNAFYKMLLSQDPEKQQKWKRDFLNHLLFMEQEGIGKLSGGGSYWFGDSPSLVDIAFYPWFERWSVLEHYRNFSLPPECKHLKQWREAMSQRDSVQAIANPPDFYISQYEKYAYNTASGITAQEMRDS